MLRYVLKGIVIVCLYSSCTLILSTNVPGKPEKSLPPEWLGKYEVITPSPFPEKKDTSEHPEKEYATIESTKITWRTNDGDKVFSLADSLRYSMIPGEGRFLSLLMPQGLYAIFKVVKNADTLEFHSLCSDDDIKKIDLNKYFDKIEKINKGEDEYYKVTIVDKKLGAYFKSAIPSKEITKLVPVR